MRLCPSPAEVFLQRKNKVLGEYRDAVFAALAIADDDLAALELDILDSKAQPFHESHAGAVEEGGHQATVRGRRLGRLSLVHVNIFRLPMQLLAHPVEGLRKGAFERRNSAGWVAWLPRIGLHSAAKSVQSISR